MPIAAATIIMNEALLLLSVKHNQAVDKIREAVITGHLRKQFDKLVEIGRQVAIKTAFNEEQAVKNAWEKYESNIKPFNGDQNVK